MPRKESYYFRKFGEKRSTVGFTKKKAIPEEYVLRNNKGHIICETWLYNGQKDRPVRSLPLSNIVKKLVIDKYLHNKQLNIMVLGSGTGENLYNFQLKLLLQALTEVYVDYRKGNLTDPKLKELITKNKFFLTLIESMKETKTYFDVPQDISNFVNKNIKTKKFLPVIDVLNITKENLSKEGKKFVQKDYSGKVGLETYFEDYNNEKLIGKYDLVNAICSVGFHSFFGPEALYKSALLLKKGGIAEVDVSIPSSIMYGYRDTDVLENYSKYLQTITTEYSHNKSNFNKFSLMIRNYFKLIERKYGMKYSINIAGNFDLYNSHLLYFVIKRIS